MILLVLIFVVPFYIGYFVVSNIRLCKFATFAHLKKIRFYHLKFFKLFDISRSSAETAASFCLYGVVYLHVFLLEVGRSIPHLEPETW